MKLFLFIQNLWRIGLPPSVIMKINLAFFFVLIASIHVSASSYAQKIKMEDKNTSLHDIFQELKNQTGYSFVYSSEKIKTTRTSIKVDNSTLENTLTILFKDLPFSFKVLKTNVLIKEDRSKM